MKLIHRFRDMTPQRRPQDPHMDGTGLRFETMEHGGKNSRNSFALAILVRGVAPQNGSRPQTF
jgi:hypothetical protein